MLRVGIVKVALPQNRCRLFQLGEEDHILLVDPIILCLPCEVVQRASLEARRVPFLLAFHFHWVGFVVGGNCGDLRRSEVDPLYLLHQLVVLHCE